MTSSAVTLYFSTANSVRRRLILRAAAFAAMPFMSEPDEAAVAEVFGTLAVLVAIGRT